MKKRNKRVLIAILLLGVGGLTSLRAQETITTSGGEASGSGGTVSYTVGQIVYTSETGTNGNSIAQGVQQPYEISEVSGIAESQGINLEVSAYPNPATGYLTVKVDASASLGIQSLEYQLFDINGQLLQTVKATGQETKIEINNLVPATYFVKVLDKEKEIKIFKIIKN